MFSDQAFKPEIMPLETIATMSPRHRPEAGNKCREDIPAAPTPIYQVRFCMARFLIRPRWGEKNTTQSYVVF